MTNELTTPPPTPSGEPFDGTKLSALMKCGLLFHLQHRLGFRPNGKAEPLDFGIAVHEICEVAANAREGWQNEPDLVEQFIIYAAFVAQKNKLAEASDKRRGVEGLMNVAILLTEMQDNWQTMATELHFDLSYEGQRFTGYIDRIVRDDIGNMFVLDYKSTVGALSQYWAEGYEATPQFTLYNWAARELGYPVKGVLIKGLQTLASGARSNTFILRSTPALMRERMMEILQWTKLAPTLVGLRNPTACNGMYKCSFYDVCARAPGRIRELAQDQGFHKAELWNPTIARPPEAIWQDNTLVYTKENFNA